MSPLPLPSNDFHYTGRKMDSKGLIDEYFGKNMRVPVYQRSYNWRCENCQVLFDDLLTSARHLDNPRISNHFFGSVITMMDQTTLVNDVIDGQQRIITISLLLASIRDCLKNGIVTSNMDNLDKRIDSLLRDHIDPSIVYLKPVEKDRDAYYRIIRSMDRPDHDSNITINYDYFIKLVSSLPGDVKLDNLYNAIVRLHVMAIRLTTEDDAQAIFESINSTGLDLSEADKIRNFILMNHPPNQQERIYQDYWLQIEKNLASMPDLTDFFKDYVIACRQFKINNDVTYKEFKKLMLEKVDPDDYSNDFERVMKEIVRHSAIYSDILCANLDCISKNASKSMRYINFIDITVSYPFFMRLIFEHQNNSGVITNSDIEKSLSYIENMLIRRQVCNKWSTGMNYFFASLFQSVSKLHSEAPFHEKLNYYLLSKKGNMAYIRDEAIKEAFYNVDLYRSKPTAASAVLALIEDSNDDTEDVLGRISSTLTVEHIMPQNKTPAWRTMMGQDYDDVYDKWLHKIGNLTLTAYNANLGDRPFEEKLHHKDGYLESRLHLNDFARDNPGVWTEKEIETRQQKLVNKFLEVMPQLESSIAIDLETDSLSIDEDPELFRGWIIKGCSFQGYEIKGNAKTIFPEIAKRLYEINPAIILGKVDEKGTGLSSKAMPGDINDCVEITSGVFIWNHYPNKNRINVLSKMLDWYGIAPSELTIYGKRPTSQMALSDSDDDADM